MSVLTAENLAIKINTMNLSDVLMAIVKYYLVSNLMLINCTYKYL